jgi:hypothetical protein
MCGVRGVAVTQATGGGSEGEVRGEEGGGRGEEVGAKGRNVAGLPGRTARRRRDN